MDVDFVVQAHLQSMSSISSIFPLTYSTQSRRESLGIGVILSSLNWEHMDQSFKKDKRPNRVGKRSNQAFSFLKDF